MAERCIGYAALNMEHGREWRIHPHDGRNSGGIGMIVDLRRFEARGGDGRKREGKAWPGCRPTPSA